MGKLKGAQQAKPAAAPAKPETKKPNKAKE